MDLTIWKTAALLVLPMIVAAAQMAAGEQEDLGNGFMHHGVATPVSNHRGTVATVDGDGNPVVLSWIMDHRGGYALLMLDATTGDAEEFPTPWRGDSPFASILSTRNRYYTHCGSWFVEFDPARREYTFEAQTVPQMAMSMTEDDNGVIWSATYPSSGVACYNPETGEFRDYGHVYDQNWRQYPRTVSADDTGWIYLGIGNTASQIIMLNPETGEATPVIPEELRGHGRAVTERYEDGKVYGRYGDHWWELYQGVATPIDEPAERNPKAYIASSQALFHRPFPGGGRLLELNLIDRVLMVETAEGERRELEFDYTSEGAHMMGLQTSPDGTVCGGTAFPMRFFSYNPRTDEWTNRAALGQWNTVTATEDRFYIGAYTHGLLEVWDPFAEWVPTERDNPDSNPRLLTEADGTINRPHDLLAYPDGRTIIMAGTPGYGLTGGGLLFYDTETGEETLLTHEQILPQLSTYSLAPLPDGKLMASTTISAGTGGEVKADHAELYIMDVASKQLDWHGPGLQGVSSYNDLVVGPNGVVFGFADGARFYAFDPATREIIHEQNTEEQFGRTNGQQGPRVFVTAPDGRIFILFRAGIAQLDPETFVISMLAEAPVPIGPGGDWLDGRIYFGSGSHMYSWQAPEAQ